MDTPVRQPVVLPATGVRPTELQLPAGTTSWGTDLKKMEETGDAMLEASRKTPPVVIAALAPKVAQMPGVAFHAFTIQTYMNLEVMGSPFVNRGAHAQEPVMSDVRDALWAMSEPDEQVEELLAVGGDKLRRSRVAFGSKIPMSNLTELSVMIADQISGGFAPAAKMNPPKQEGGATPLEQTSSATAPAGS